MFRGGSDLPKTIQHVQNTATAGTQVNLTRKSQGPQPLCSNDSNPFLFGGRGVGGKTTVLSGNHTNLLTIASLQTEAVSHIPQ